MGRLRRRPAADETSEKPDFAARSITLASEQLGIIAKMDLVEGEDGTVTPVDTKKGKRPHVAEGAYEPERVQVCAQVLILEDAGYKVGDGAIWYAGSRERVRIVLDEALRARTRAAISELRLTAAADRLPPPPVDSPKCTRCSLAGICLPDEVAFFRRGLAPRPLNPSADTAQPLYVQEPGARVSKSGEVLVVATEDKKTEVPIGDVSELVLHGPVSVTTPAIGALLRDEIPITYASGGGWVLGHTVSTGHKNVAIRMAQYRAAFDEHRALAFARSLVAVKIRNARVFLRRNFKSGNETERDGALDVDAAQDLARRLLRRAPPLERARSTIGHAGSVGEHITVHDLAVGGEDVEGRADVDVALLVEGEVLARESTVLALGAIPDGNVRGDPLFVDHPIERRCRPVRRGDSRPAERRSRNCVSAASCSCPSFQTPVLTAR
jgi:CRISPR-associated exonuclease Cas4/CRISPR-associated protein Cas1